MNDQFQPPEETLHEKNIRKARERVIESIAKNIELYGVTRSIGHLYGTLLFQNNAMTLDEMGEALGMSKTSMSTGVRTLLDLKMVNKVWMKGSRKDHYEVEQDWYQNFIDYFTIKWRAAVDDNMHALHKSAQELHGLLKQDLPEQLQAEVKADLEKINSGLDYYEWLSQVLDLFESHEIFQYVPKPEKKEME